MNKVMKNVSPTRVLERYYQVCLGQIDAIQGHEQLQDLNRLDLVGYSNGQLNAGSAVELLKQVNILDDAGNDQFTNHLILPAYDFNNILTDIIGINLDDSKEKTAIQSPAIYNSQACRLHSELHVYNTTYSALRSAETNVIALLGGVSEDDLQVMKSYGVSTLILHDISAELSSILKQYFNIKIDGEDSGYQLPDSVESLTAESFNITFDTRRYNFTGLNRKNGKLKCTVKVYKGSVFHLDSLNFTSNSQRHNFIKTVCRELKFNPDEITTDIQKLIPILEHYDYDSGTNYNPAVMSDSERDEALGFAKSENLIETIKTDLGLEIVGESDNAFISYLASTSRLLERPVSVNLYSASASGKSSLVSKVLKFMPEEDIMYFTALSDKSFLYRKEDIKHMIIQIEEISGVKDDYQLRCIVSEQKLAMGSTERDPLSCGMESSDNRIKAIASVFTTSTKKLHTETQSRFLKLELNHSKEQSLAIANNLIASRCRKGREKTKIIATRHRLHQNFQRLLKPLRVEYIDGLVEQIEFDCQRLQSRRDLPKFLTLIDSVAILRQHQKIMQMDEDGEEYIIADADDLRVVRECSAGLFNYDAINELSNNARYILKLITTNFNDTEFTKRDVWDYADVSEATTRRGINELKKFEFIGMAKKVSGIPHYQIVSHASQTVVSLK
jgi:hypothetical protein